MKLFFYLVFIIIIIIGPRVKRKSNVESEEEANCGSFKLRSFFGDTFFGVYVRTTVIHVN